MEKDDLIEAFSKACLELACFLDEYVGENLDAEATQYLYPIVPTTMPDIDYTWWSDYGELEAYTKQIKRLDDSGRLTKEYEKGLGQLNENPAHLVEHLKIAKEAKSPLEYMKYLPHIIGLTDDKYGDDLKETVGYQALKAVCETIDKTNFAILMVNNPGIETLKSSFCLAVMFYTEDEEPVATKVERVSAEGLFATMRDHYGLS